MKTALITGGTGSIGAALVEEFSSDYEVYFTYFKNKDEALRLEKTFSAHGLYCDVRNANEIEKNCKELKSCDLLINNAGISQIKLFTDISTGDWEEMLAVNLSSVFHFTKQILPHMIKKKQGNIINISSVWGSTGASCEVHYSAVKAGVIGLTRALSKEVGLSGVRVNCIAPGVIDSRMNNHFNDEERLELKAICSLNRLGTPFDVALAARFLEKSEFVTGQVLGVDGGI